MRSINDAVAMLRDIDPETSITPYRVRLWVAGGRIPFVSAGQKRLINVDRLIEMLASGEFDTVESELEPETPTGMIRRIG